MKWFKVVLQTTLFLILLTVKSLALARTLDDFEFTAVSQSVTLAQLQKVKQQVWQLRVWESACRDQLKLDHVPDYCFIYLKQLRAINVSQPQDLIVDEKNCVMTARKTQQTQWPRFAMLPQKCSVAARERVRLNRYKAGMGIDL